VKLWCQLPILSNCGAVIIASINPGKGQSSPRRSSKTLSTYISAQAGEYLPIHHIDGHHLRITSPYMMVEHLDEVRACQIIAGVVSRRIRTPAIERSSLYFREIERLTRIDTFVVFMQFLGKRIPLARVRTIEPLRVRVLRKLFSQST
jgi:hypothetical protein